MTFVSVRPAVVTGPSCVSGLSACRCGLLRVRLRLGGVCVGDRDVEDRDAACVAQLPAA